MSQKDTASKKQVPLSQMSINELLNEANSAFEILKNKDKTHSAAKLIEVEKYLRNKLMPAIDKRQKIVEEKLSNIISKTKTADKENKIDSSVIQKKTKAVFKQLNDLVDKQHEYEKLTLQRKYDEPIKNFDTLNPFQRREAIRLQSQKLEKNTAYKNELAELKQDQADYKVKLEEDWQVATLNQKEIDKIQDDIVKGFAGLFNSTDRVSTFGAIKNILQQKSKKEGDYLVPFNKLGKIDKVKLIPKLIGDVVGKTKLGTTAKLIVNVKDIKNFAEGVISMDKNQQADDPRFWKKFVENDDIWNGITDVMQDPKIRVDRVLGNLLGTALFKDGGALDAKGSKLLSDFIVSDKDKIRELVLDGLQIATIAKTDPKLAQEEVIKRDLPGKAIDLIEKSPQAKAFFKERSGMLVSSFIDTVYASTEQSEGLSSLRKLAKARKQGKALLSDVGLTPESAKQLGGIVPILLKDENFTAFRKVYDHVKEGDFIKVASEVVDLTEKTPEIAKYLRQNQELMTNLANNVFSKIPELQQFELKQDLLDIVPKLLEHPKELKQIINAAGAGDVGGMTKSITDFVTKTEISEYLGKQGKDAAAMALKAFALDKGVNPDVIIILSQVTNKDNLHKINDIVSDLSGKDSSITDKMRGASKLFQLLQNDKTIKTYFSKHKQDLAKLMDFALSNVPEASKHLGNAQIGKFATTILQSVVSLGQMQEDKKDKGVDWTSTEIAHSTKNISKMSEIIKLAANLDSMGKAKELITKGGSAILSSALDMAKKDKGFAATWESAGKGVKSVYDTAAVGAKFAYDAAYGASQIAKEGVSVAKDYMSRDLQAKKQILANQILENITSKASKKNINLSSAVVEYTEQGQFANAVSELYKKDKKPTERFKDLAKSSQVAAQDKERVEKLQGLAKNNKLFESVHIKATKEKPISFNGVTIDRTNFRNATLENVYMSGAKITGADFSSAKFTNVNFKGAEIDGKTLSTMISQLQDKQISLSGVKITGTIPEGTDLTNIDFKEANLSELQSLKGVDLKGVDFSTNNTIKDQVLSTGYNFQSTKAFEANTKDTNIIHDIAERVYPNKLNPKEAALRQDLREMYLSDSKIGKYLRTSLSADIEDIKKTDLSQKFDDKKLSPYKTGTFMLMMKKHKGNHESFKQELTAHIFADYLIDELQPKFVDKETFSVMKDFIAQSLEKSNIKPDELLANQEKFLQTKELINNAIKADVEKNNAWVNQDKTNIVTARYDDEDKAQRLVSSISKAMDQAVSLSAISHRFIQNVTNQVMENDELKNNLLQDKDKLEFKQKIFDSIAKTLQKNNVDIKELSDSEVKKLQEDFTKQINTNIKVQTEEKKIPGRFYGHTIVQEAKIETDIESIENNLSKTIKDHASLQNISAKNVKQRGQSKTYKTHSEIGRESVYKSHAQSERAEVKHSKSYQRDAKTIAKENVLAEAKKIVEDYKARKSSPESKQNITKEELLQIGAAKRAIRHHEREVNAQKAIATPMKPKEDVEIKHDGNDNLAEKMKRAVAQALKNIPSKTDVQKQNLTDQKNHAKSDAKTPVRDAKISDQAKKIGEKLQKESKKRDAEQIDKPSKRKVVKRFAKKSISWGRGSL